MLPNKTWLYIKGKIGGIVAGKSKKKTGYTLIAESIDGFKTNGRPSHRFYISSTKTTRFIYRLIDQGLHRKTCIVLKYIDIETYVVEIYGKHGKEIKSLAEEMGIVRSKK